MPRLASANSKNSWRGAREETEPLGLMLAFGDVEIGEVVRVPYEAAAQGDPASARQVTLGELRDRVVARARRALSGGGKVDFAACVLLCLLDGVPTPAPPREEPRRGASN